MNELPEVKAFPTIRAQIGDWFYYVTTLPFYEVANRIRPATEFFHPPSLNEWIQREVMPRRRKEIAEYVLTQPERFFNGIVVGVYLGDPEWYNIEVQANNIFGTPGLDERFEQALGILRLNGDEQLYAIDGQHRVAGIKEALSQLLTEGRTDEYQRLAHEDIAVIFVSADMDADKRERVRRMFSTLNKQARPVSKAELIALDEDDPSAIVARRIATRYDGLNRSCSPPAGTGRRGRSSWGLIHLGKGNQIPQSNTYSITTIVTLLDVVRSAFKGELNRLKNTLNKGSEGFSGGYWGSFAEILRPPGLFSQMCRPLIALRRGRCNL